jgi:hypothetical protein
MPDDPKPKGFATLVEALVAIIAHERARRRTASETPWPPVHERRADGMVYGSLVRRE